MRMRNRYLEMVFVARSAPPLSFDDTLKLELRWLMDQTRPVWGGHILRGEQPNELLASYIRSGYVERTDDGYVITELGFNRLVELEREASPCPTSP